MVHLRKVGLLLSISINQYQSVSISISQHQSESSVLVEEGVRRLRNHSRELEWERSRKVMEDWSRKLRRSGYPATMRHEVIKAAVDRYEKMCMEEDEGVRPIHRPRNWKEKERRS